MIELINVYKEYKVNNSKKIVLNNISLKLNANKGIAILGNNGQGKSTLMRMIAGTELPNKGYFVRNTTLSWPMGLSGTFQPSMTGRDNMKFVARIYDRNVKEVNDYVEEFSELKEYLDMPVSTYSNGMKSKLAFGLSLAINFETYLIDEIISVGDNSFRIKSKEELKKKVTNAKVILISHHMETIREFCDKVAILKDGNLVLYNDIEEGIKKFENE